jgi:hypothetical protein
MTPQSSFMVVAGIRPDRRDELTGLLSAMTRRPGEADPRNPLVPFGEFDTLHFARFVILDDATTEDVAAHGVPVRTYSPALALLGDVDGDPREFIRDLVRRAEPGLRRIFLCCDGFTERTDLFQWMTDREHPPAALYVNWRGRTMRQVREEIALASWVANVLRADPSAVRHSPRELHQFLRGRMHDAVSRRELTLTPEAATPLQWRLRNAAHAVAGPLAALLLLPFILLYLPIFAFQLRRREKRDPEIVPRVSPAHVTELATIEDHDVSNQFSAMGSIKPGLFRRWLLTVLLVGIDYTARHIYVRGRLARVHTIHAARWVFLDGRARVFFGSNYDGSLESYMDDFINKVAFGLNVVFSNGVGYPATRWLVLGGAKDEQKFKAYIRRHQLVTQVWYNAHAGHTAHQLERNSRLRQGLESASPSDSELAAWGRVL